MLYHRDARKGLIPCALAVVLWTGALSSAPETKQSDPLIQPSRAELQPKTATDEPTKKSQSQDFVALGEIIAVQRRKGSVRISAPEYGPVFGRSTRAIQRYFLKKRSRLVIRNRLGRSIGHFQVTRVQVEHGHRPRRLRAITLHGLFEIEKTEEVSHLAVGYAVGYLRAARRYLPPTFQPPAHRPIKRIRNQIDGKWMVFVPASRLVFGQGHAPEQDNYNPYFSFRDPPVIPRVAALYMDETEVTNHEYWLFCRKSGYPMPSSWKKGRYLAGRGQHPFTEASYNDAQAYARWAGKRLPTEFEWELAARGSLNRLADDTGPRSLLRNPPLYPFGNEFDSERCNTLESGLGDTMPVTNLRDASPYGLLGMCGNAREWTSSWYRPYPGHKFLEQAPAGTIYKVIRGGSYAHPARFARADYRDYGGFPSLRDDRSAGFRLVRAAN